MFFVKSSKVLTLAAIVFVSYSFAPTKVQANEFIEHDYSCAQLWRLRNGIYASKGYCFKTKRAKRAYPDSCFSPFGKLSRAEKREVSLIKKAERYRQC